MSFEVSLTPLSLVYRKLGGTVAFLLSMVLCLSANKLHPQWLRWSGIGFSGLIAVLSVVTVAIAGRRLSRGLSADAWDAATVEEARVWIFHPRRVWAWVILSAVAIVCLNFIFGFRGAQPLNIGYLTLYSMFSSVCNDLRRATQGLNADGVLSQGWSGLKPIRSEHWGER